LRQYYFAKKLQNQTVTREKLRKKALMYKKGACKMFVKLTPGFNVSTYECTSAGCNSASLPQMMTFLLILTTFIAIFFNERNIKINFF
jgi:hypothetical protein